MKIASVADVKAHFSAYLKASEQEPVLITRRVRKRDRGQEAGQVRRKRDRSDIAKSGEFSACPYCQ
jgi:hypothetical protein